MITPQERTIFERELGGRIEYVAPPTTDRNGGTWYRFVIYCYNGNRQYVYIQEPTTPNSNVLEAIVSNSSSRTGMGQRYDYLAGRGWRRSGRLAFVPRDGGIGGGPGIQAVHGPLNTQSPSISMTLLSNPVERVVIRVEEIRDRVLDTIAESLGFDNSIMTSSDWNSVAFGITMGLVDTVVSDWGIGSFTLRNGARSLLLSLSGRNEASWNGNYYYISAKTQTQFTIFVLTAAWAEGSLWAARSILEAAGVILMSVGTTTIVTAGAGAPVGLTLAGSAVYALKASLGFALAGLAFSRIALDARTAWEADSLTLRRTATDTAREFLERIARKKGIGECIEAAREMADHLRRNNLDFRFVEIQYDYGPILYVFSRRRGLERHLHIGRFGYHIGILYEGLVQCVVHPSGLPRDTWINDFVTGIYTRFIVISTPPLLPVGQGHTRYSAFVACDFPTIIINNRPTIIPTFLEKEE